MSIDRYAMRSYGDWDENIYMEMAPDSDGEWVRISDHLEIIAAIRLQRDAALAHVKMFEDGCAMEIKGLLGKDKP